MNWNRLPIGTRTSVRVWVESLFELKKVIDELDINPHRWAIEYSTTRIGMLDRFPFSVHYRAYTNRVRILGVIHQSRDDTDIRNRN